MAEVVFTSFLIKGVIERVGGLRQTLIVHRKCFVLFLAYLCMRRAMSLRVWGWILMLVGGEAWYLEHIYKH